ncbi:CheY-like protein, partial [Aureobasidium melanogenum]
MPGLRATFRGLLKRSHSTGSSSAEPQPAQQHDQDAAAAGSRSTSRDYGPSAPHIAALKSPSKFSVQDSIREEESDEHFHDAVEASTRPSTNPPASNRNSASITTAPALDPQPQPPPTGEQSVDHRDSSDKRHEISSHLDNPSLILQCATPEKPVDLKAEYVVQTAHSDNVPRADKDASPSTKSLRPHSPHSRPHSPVSIRAQPSPSLPSLPLSLPPKRPSENTVRRQSLLSGANAPIIRALLSPNTVAQFPLPPSTPPATIEASDYFVDTTVPPVPNMASMLARKVWVKRPNASPTMVTVREDDLVDDVRDLVMRKYGNSLGRTYDSPDLVLRIVSRPDENGKRAPERILSPDEDVCRTLDSYYAGGQTAEEALLIETPARRTPRPSPRIYHGASYAALDDYRPAETGTDYFPPMPAVQLPPNVPGQAPVQQTLHPDPPRSIAVLNTGQIPVLPSPGSVRRHRDPRDPRPKFNRQHTSSPTIMTHNPPATSMPLNASNLAISQHMPTIRQTRPRAGSSVSEQQGHAPPAPSLPTPPATDAVPSGSTPPTPASQNQTTLKPARPRRQRKLTPTDGTPTVKSPNTAAKTPLPPSLLDGAVPPINVLIVEDNIINLRLLEAFMKRLKVRWSTALNGQIAVNKWRTGGFHLVLMDIQMPIMNGLEATKEIRRLERANGIGVFSTASTPAPYSDKSREQEPEPEEKKDDDKLGSDGGLFKSPVIIVALTASSLQSDRHEALAAGCNDFLTKPVNFVWLERKVKEWGCMQALIDFDGWRKWKDFDADKAAKEKKAKRVSRASAEGAPKSPRPPTTTAEAPAQSNGEDASTNEAT